MTSPGPMIRTRRAFLSDVGRATLGAVVLGTGLAACSDDDADDTGGATGVDAGQAEGSLAWERASFGFVSAYVLVRGGEAAVFDAGTGDDGVGPIGDALRAAGVDWDAVGHVILSHRHGDHAGGLSAVFAEAPDATLYAAMPDLDNVRDRADNVREVRDADRVLGLRIVATPGHTLGHIAAFDDASGLLLTGDAVVHDRSIGGTTGEGIEASPPDFTEDMDQALASVATLADLSPEAMLFGHGDPLTMDAATELRTYADSL